MTRINVRRGKKSRRIRPAPLPANYLLCQSRPGVEKPYLPHLPLDMTSHAISYNAMIVVDANVMLSALRSSRGASHQLLREMLVDDVAFAVSPAVALEYEDVLKRPGILGDNPWLGEEEIDTVLDAVFGRARLVSPWFRFRPFLADPKDDIYIECALAAGATLIISNDRHFQHPAVNAFGISVMGAGDFVTDRTRKRQPT
jgi:putative PIN family toxin of toxin-antitoxin system